MPADLQLTDDAGNLAVPAAHYRRCYTPMPAEGIMQLTDDAEDRMLHPTRRNILKGFK